MPERSLDPAPAKPSNGAVEGDALDVQVGADDPDRWLATRLIAAPGVRREIVALYAFYGEVRGVSRRARQPLAGELRLAWWLEAVERVRGGGVADHPALEALSMSLREGRLEMEPVERIIEARRRTLDGDALADDAGRVALFDDTAGALMEAAAALLDPSGSRRRLRDAGRAWGWSRLAARPTVDADLRQHASERARAALGLARGEVRALPVASFPAVAYLALMDDRLAGRRRSEIGRRARLLWATATGRV